MIYLIWLKLDLSLVPLYWYIAARQRRPNEMMREFDIIYSIWLKSDFSLFEIPVFVYCELKFNSSLLENYFRNLDTPSKFKRELLNNANEINIILK